RYLADPGAAEQRRRHPERLLHRLPADGDLRLRRPAGWRRAREEGPWAGGRDLLTPPGEGRRPRCLEGGVAAALRGRSLRSLRSKRLEGSGLDQAVAAGVGGSLRRTPPGERGLRHLVDLDAQGAADRLGVTGVRAEHRYREVTA